MATTLDTLVGSSDSPRDRSVVVDYSAELRKHTNEKSGEVSYALVISPVFSTGAKGRNALWIWLDGPASLRAFRDSMQRTAKGIDALDAKMVAAKEWAARPVAPKAEAGKPASSAAAPVEAPKTVLDNALSDLPF
jgi:hypothetical protein